MKAITSIALSLLLSDSQAIRTNFMSVGEKIQRSQKLVQISSEVSQWDSDIIGLVDMKDYTEETKSVTAEQNMNIEFERQNNEEEETE